MCLHKFTPKDIFARRGKFVPSGKSMHAGHMLCTVASVARITHV